MLKYLRLVQLPAHRRQRAAVRLTRRALRDDRGGEVMEYAIILGLIVVGAVTTIGCVGTKILARWTSVRDSM